MYISQNTNDIKFNFRNELKKKYVHLSHVYIWDIYDTLYKKLAHRHSYAIIVFSSMNI